MPNGATDKLSYDISHAVRQQWPKIQNSTNWSYVHIQSGRLPLAAEPTTVGFHLFSSMHVKFDLI